MSVCVLLCTLYTTCFGPDQWPSSSDLKHKIQSNVVTNISTDPLSQIYKRAKAVVTVSLKHVVIENAKIFKAVFKNSIKGIKYY
jgi:hypothetical protein